MTLPTNNSPTTVSDVDASANISDAVQIEDKATAVQRFITHGMAKEDPTRLAALRATLDEALPYQTYIDELAGKLETPESFCRRELRSELLQTHGTRFGINDNIRLTPANSADGESYTCTLLQAAMLNFTDEEAAPGYFSNDSEILDILGQSTVDDPDAIRVSAQEFAALSRNLDLGGQYQKHIARTFKVSNIELIGTRLHKFNMKLSAYEKYFKKTDFPLNRLLTVLSLTKGNRDIYTGDNINNGKIKLHSIQLFGKYTTDAVLITCRRTDQSPIDHNIVYIPNDPGDGFYQDDNEDQTKYRFSVNFLTNKEFRTRLVSQLTNTEKNEIEAMDLNSISFVNDITFIPLKKGLYKHFFDRYLDKLSADARDIAVPLANVNEPAYANRRKAHTLPEKGRLSVSPTHDFSKRLRTYATDELLASVFAGLGSWTAIEKYNALSRLLDLKKRLSPPDAEQHGLPVDAD
ncbi:dermonecrotic toxin domain-containing protein [Pseudomonas sp. NPDC087614]|uniref:dermonecrotic toxin domain-containing protein n=1 Tax=Pseudomonas sp. NPDC087614 TaxID=3364442 RepID=UPI00380B8475